jgi:hypothetical protein
MQAYIRKLEVPKVREATYEDTFPISPVFILAIVFGFRYVSYYFNCAKETAHERRGI